MQVVIVGGGAAGCIAAGAAGRQGHAVTVVERNARPARKVMITGKGRCNVTNDCSVADFLPHVRRGGRFLYSALTAFSPADTMALLEALGVRYADIEAWGGKVVHTDSQGIAEAFEKGEADLTIDHIAARQENTTRLCEGVPMRFPQLKEETLNHLVEMGFGVIDVEPGMFAGQTEAIAAVGSQQVVLVRQDMDAALAQALARAVCEHAVELAKLSPALERFVPMYAGTAELCGAEVHAGAAQYYWEQGYPQK